MPRSARSRPFQRLASFAAGAIMVLAPVATAQPAENWDNVIIPQHRILLPPERRDSVFLESVDVGVVIRDQVATTTVGMLLRNPSSRAQESQLLMPVPAGASVRQFRLEGLPDEGIARMLEREEARRIYESIVRRTRDPGLIEFVGLNLIRSSVFPVPANGTQRMELVYEQVLVADGTRVDYSLPRSESLERSGTKWTMSAVIHAPRAIGAIYSPSHELATERRPDGSVRVTVPDSSANDPGAFRLSYMLSETDGLSSSLVAYPDPKVGDGRGGYFMLLLGVPAEADRPRMQREVTIVIDRSGSMRGEKLDQARAAALQIIEALDNGEHFNIVDYSDNIESFAPTSVPKNAQTVQNARRYLEALKAVGGTNIHDALVHALSPAPPEGVLPMVLFLTDGLPTVGVRSERDIREAARSVNKHGRRIFSFGVGFDVNSPLLTAIADASRGAPTFVMPDEDIEVKVGQVFRRLKGPVLTAPELSFAAQRPSDLAGSPVRELLPGSLGDVYEGDQVTVFGQYVSGSPVTFTLTGADASGEPVRYEVSFSFDDASVRNSYVPRIWATRKIGELISEIRRSGSEGNEADRELVDEVIRLSTEYGILTEYTAFLAAEPNDFFRLGEALSGEPGLARPSDVRRQVDELLGRRALRERSGGGSVSQDANIEGQVVAERLNARNRLYYFEGGNDAAGLEETTFVSVRQSADQTLYLRHGRWVESRLLAQEAEEPEHIIEFASDEYFALADRLAGEHRQSVLAVQGDVYLLLDGRRTLVRQTAP